MSEGAALFRMLPLNSESKIDAIDISYAFGDQFGFSAEKSEWIQAHLIPDQAGMVDGSEFCRAYLSHWQYVKAKASKSWTAARGFSKLQGLGLFGKKGNSAGSEAVVEDVNSHYPMKPASMKSPEQEEKEEKDSLGTVASLFASKKGDVISPGLNQLNQSFVEPSSQDNKENSPVNHKAPAPNIPEYYNLKPSPTGATGAANNTRADVLTGGPRLIASVNPSSLPTWVSKPSHKLDPEFRFSETGVSVVESVCYAMDPFFSGTMEVAPLVAFGEVLLGYGGCEPGCCDASITLLKRSSQGRLALSLELKPTM